MQYDPRLQYNATTALISQGEPGDYLETSRLLHIEAEFSTTMLERPVCSEADTWSESPTWPHARTHFSDHYALQLKRCQRLVTTKGGLNRFHRNENRGKPTATENAPHASNKQKLSFIAISRFGMYRILQNKRPGQLIFESKESNSKPHQNPSVLCTPPCEKSLFWVGAFFGVSVHFGKYGDNIFCTPRTQLIFSTNEHQRCKVLDTCKSTTPHWSHRKNPGDFMESYFNLKYYKKYSNVVWIKYKYLHKIERFTGSNIDATIDPGCPQPRSRAQNMRALLATTVLPNIAVNTTQLQFRWQNDIIRIAHGQVQRRRRFVIIVNETLRVPLNHVTHGQKCAIIFRDANSLRPPEKNVQEKTWTMVKYIHCKTSYEHVEKKLRNSI